MLCAGRVVFKDCDIVRVKLSPQIDRTFVTEGKALEQKDKYPAAEYSIFRS